jgi:hypothetical protein
MRIPVADLLTAEKAAMTMLYIQMNDKPKTLASLTRLPPGSENVKPFSPS